MRNNHNKFAITLMHDSEFRKVYFFHDVRLTCQANHPAILALLEKMLAGFPVPQKIRGEATLRAFYYKNATRFPLSLPEDRVRIGKIRLLTGTIVRYYTGSNHAIEYQHYEALDPINAPILSIIDSDHANASIQLEHPERYEATFLGRYPLLMALGALLHPFGFEPCHAAAVSAPWDDRQGVLIVGDSGSGKTTLSLGCASSGFGFLGDDLVMLHTDPAGAAMQALTIGNEVSVRSPSLDLWQNLAFLRALPADRRDKRYCSIEQIRPGASKLQTTIRLLLFPRLTTGTRSTCIPLSKAAALQELIDQCISRKSMYPQAQQALFLHLSTLAEQAPAYRVAIARGTTDGPQLIGALLTGGAR
ncbi:MAG: hypothetical protein M3Z08_06885 [Chloroflexota bacterium]|nr:hypothetical protein [Chloroflexota bacterium]